MFIFFLTPFNQDIFPVLKGTVTAHGDDVSASEITRMGRTSRCCGRGCACSLVTHVVLRPLASYTARLLALGMGVFPVAAGTWRSLMNVGGMFSDFNMLNFCLLGRFKMFDLISWSAEVGS